MKTRAWLAAAALTLVWGAGCTQKEAPPKAPAASTDTPSQEKNAAAPTPTKGAPAASIGACDAAALRQGADVLQNPSTSPAMLAVFALNGLALGCPKHPGMVTVVKTLTSVSTGREAKMKGYADGVWASMALLERSCHAGQKVINHIGPAQMSGKDAQVALAKHCRFVEQGLLTRAELPALDNGYVPLVPIFQSLMAASKIDAGLQRILLRGVMGLKTPGKKTPAP